MKKKQFLLILFVVMVIFFSGCLNHSEANSLKSNNHIDYSGNENANKKTDNDITNSDAKILFNIKILRVSRENFNFFLADPQKNTLQASEEYEFFQNNQFYVTYSVVPFHINEQFAAFVNDKIEIERFLSKKGINITVENVVLFEAPHTPITLIINSGENVFFITVNEDRLNDEGYVYRLYSSEEYTNRYIRKNGTLLVENTRIETANRPQVYYDYADIPLFAVLKAFGAEINIDGSTSSIKYNNNNYFLDMDTLALYKNDSRDIDLLHCVVGGPLYTYKQNGDIMVDIYTLENALHRMGLKVSITVDSQEKTVHIKAK